MPNALQFVVLTPAGWPNRQQQDAIDNPLAENRVLREQLGCKRLRLTEAQSRQRKPPTRFGDVHAPARPPTTTTWMRREPSAEHLHASG